MKSMIPFILSACLVLGASAVFSANEPVHSSNKVSYSTIDQKKASSFLFVVQAKKGEIIYNKKTGQHELILNKTDVHHVIEFSDRPYRIVKYITGKDLASDWSEGHTSFKDDPPNAVVSGSGKKAEIVILTSINVKGQQVVFGIQGYTANRSFSQG